MTKPTGYTVTMSADVFWCFMHLFGGYSEDESKAFLRVSDDLYDRLYKTWDKFDDQLNKDHIEDIIQHE